MRRPRGGASSRCALGFRALLYAALPSHLMRAGAQWIADKEGLADADRPGSRIGYITGDLGALLLIVATVPAGLRRLRRAGRGRGTPPGHARSPPGRAVLIVAYLVAIWAMTTKPV